MTKGAIFSLTLAVLMTTIVVLMVIFKNGAEYVSSQGLSFNENGIVVGKEYKACQTDADCTTVSTQCDSCECGEPIARKYASEAKTLLQNVCKGYQGGVCDINCQPFTIKCQNNLCVKQLFDEVDQPTK